ncbi:MULTISPECIES: hypothetical protein [unclassified Streptomyces]|uniref:hypothetical protein n=1 Tax=unclassified Streptomyces TaxID=2593676 RepID=UPI002E13D7AB|nr:hypothetical protein OG457_07890 [Streptomyces sp. NBC_01207]WTA17150.1 hypothetical protein OG365_03310 [Streptomyces sp. NBC_00853]
MTALGRALTELGSGADDLAATNEVADLRSVLTGLYVGQDVGRIDLLTRQVGDIAWERRSVRPLPEELRLPVREIGEVCLTLIGRTSDVVALSAPHTVVGGELADISRRQQALGRLLLEREQAIAVTDAVDAAVIGRCYEECAYRAVAVARHAALLRETTSGR